MPMPMPNARGSASTCAGPSSSAPAPLFRAAVRDPLQGRGSLQERRLGAREGLKPAPVMVNAGSGCSAAVKPGGAGDR
jgi:hypothetical protein